MNDVLRLRFREPCLECHTTNQAGISVEETLPACLIVQILKFGHALSGGSGVSFLVEPDGTLVISGGVDQVDGIPYSGIARLKPAPVWRRSTFVATGRFTGTIGCLAGWNHHVEASADFKQWDTVATGTSTGESVPFADTAPPGPARRFYRVVKE